MPRSLARLLVAVPVAWLALGLVVAPVAAVDGLTMTSRALLDGHARIGSWVAIAVDLSNDGPPIVGELALAAGTTGKTRYAVPVDLPTQSDKTYVIHAQAPSFGGRLTVSLVTSGGVLEEQNVDVTVHDSTQLVVGVVAERPQGLAGAFRLLPGPAGSIAAVVPLQPADLPTRVEAWSALDRLVWQDVDTDTLSTEQLAALAGWIAGGGRLVIVGGTAGPDVLSALPDELLPYRPTATVDVPPGALTSLLGVAPAAATDVPGLAGSLVHGRALARVGDEVVAAEASFGAGSVALIGVDASTGWLATANGTEGLWRRLLPARSSNGIAITDDSRLLGAVSQLPALALPPIGGLIAILAAYIILVGPVNYIVLRRLDRREWAWVSIPLLIVGFTVGAYAIGATLRGSDVIVHEVAIIRGAADAGRGTSVVYAGVFSPTRGTYQVSVPGGALLSAPINGDFGGDSGSTLDIVQGEPSRIRDLAVGFGSLRTIRAETPVAVPTLSSDLRLEGDTVVGTLRNTSDMTIDQPSLVIGANVQTWQSLAPGGSVDVHLALTAQPFGGSLSDVIVGQAFAPDSKTSEDTAQSSVRRALIDSLTVDPSFGFSGNLPADGPVLLGWTDDPVVSVDLAEHQPRTAATTLYQLALPLRANGAVVYRNDMIRSTIVSVDAPTFNKVPFDLAMAQGSLTMTYRPMGLDGTLAATRLVLSLNQGGNIGDVGAGGAEIEPTGPATKLDACVAQACPAAPADFLPEVEILDRQTGSWMALPHFQGGTSYVIKEPTRYVDPDGGTVWIRFQNQRLDNIDFAFGVRIEGNAS